VTGWIRLPRALLEHALWTDTPQPWLRTWIYILLRANWKSTRWFDGRETIDVPAGCFITSLAKLSRETRNTLQNTRSALAFLNNNTMIETQSNTRWTLIKVLKWHVYGGEGEPSNTAKGAVDNREITPGLTDEQHPPQQQSKNLRIKNQERKKNADPDDLPTNLKSDSSAGLRLPVLPLNGNTTLTPDLKRRLQEYVRDSQIFKHKRLTDRTITEIQAAAELGLGKLVSDEQICGVLDQLWNEGFAPGTTKEPKTWRWFQITIRDRFAQRRAGIGIASSQSYSAAASGSPDKLAHVDFQEGMNAIELPEARPPVAPAPAPRRLEDVSSGWHARFDAVYRRLEENRQIDWSQLLYQLQHSDEEKRNRILERLESM
jgi:hypothetical protein